MATLTSSAASAVTQPRLVHAGVNVVKGTYTFNGATCSAGDVIQMVKIPHGASIVEMIFSGTSGAAATTFTIGDGSLSNRFISTAVTLSATTALFRYSNGAGAGYTVSVSDDAVNQFDTIDVTCQATSATVTASLQLIVFYVAPGQI